MPTDAPMYMRDTVSMVHHLAALRQQQIEREMTVKEVQRAERLVDLYMRQAGFLVRQLTRPAKALHDITEAERAEAKGLRLSMPDCPTFPKLAARRWVK